MILKTVGFSFIEHLYLPTVEYGKLVAIFNSVEDTPETLEKTRLLAELFADVDTETLQQVVKLVRGKLFANWESGDLGISTSLTVDAISKATGIGEEQIESWWREEGDLGDAAYLAVENKTQETLYSTTLTVEDVFTTLRELGDYEGEGSQQKRVDTLAGLLGDASTEEARFIVRTVVGAMRLGVGEGIVRDAIAEAFLSNTEQAQLQVEGAFEVTNDFALVAKTAKNEGFEGLEEVGVELFRPIKPMLAQKGESLEEAFSELVDSTGRVLIEAKYDGIRAKVHSDGTKTKLFTRRLEDVTTQFPDVTAAVEEAVTPEEFILEGEIVGFSDETGRPVPFQELSQRIKRKYEIAEMVEELPVVLYVFDVLYCEGNSFIETPLRQRVSKLEDMLHNAEGKLVRADATLTDSKEKAAEFYESTLSEGHEGIMIKNLDATYQPGSRVGYQQKIKATMESLDLVVTRAKWSEGRKSGFLGRPYLACKDRSNGTFKEVGRMHTGFTDEQLESFTNLVEPLIQEIDGREAKLSPEIVLEVEFEEIQESPKYDSGFALRFPRLVGIRDDFDERDVDTLEKVEQLYEEQK